MNATLTINAQRFADLKPNRHQADVKFSEWKSKDSGSRWFSAEAGGKVQAFVADDPSLRLEDFKQAVNAALN